MTSKDHQSQVQALLKDIATFEHQTKDVYANEALRARLLQSAKRLVSALEKPGDAVFDNAFLPVQSTCVRIAVDLDLFELIAQVAQEEEMYTATPLTVQMTTPASQACIRHHSEFANPTLAQLPALFEENGYQTPTSITSGPLQCTFATNLPSFDYWATPPSNPLQNFNTFMTGNRGSRPSWIEWFPVEHNVLRGAREDSDAVLIVDVAGGWGHDLEAFRRKFPDVNGRMILQDLPGIISDIQYLEDGIERMAHDIFSPQPIKGARVYFLHLILRNWPDAFASQILTQIAAAMTPGYSKLLLNEFSLPNTDAPLLASSFDWQMMVLPPGMGRSERHWRELIRGVGLEIVDFWQGEEGGEGIIEVVKEA